MALRRRHVELAVERPLGGRGPPGSIARLTARFDVAGEGAGPTPAELTAALDDLLRELDSVVGASLGEGSEERRDRDLRELVETYRPRQRELVDVLLADGELTPREHTLLLGSLSSRPSAPAAPRAPAISADLTPVGETPIAAVPLAAEPKLPPARPVPELLRTFQIASLKQAGAVRARRQISFAEYMALKRHFEGIEASDGSGPTAGAR